MHKDATATGHSGSIRVGFVLAFVLVLATVVTQYDARGADVPNAKSSQSKKADELAPPVETPKISAEQQAQLDASVDKALTFLAANQEPDGSFKTLDVARPAVTSLCVMSFLARGHRPGKGNYGDT